MLDDKAIQPLSLDQCMKGFDACVVPRVAFVGIAADEFLRWRGLKILFRNIRATAITMNDDGLATLALQFSFFNGVYDRIGC